MAKLKIKCAWCGKIIGEKEGEGVEGTTDGICDDCLLYYFPHLYDKIKAIIGEEEVKSADNTHDRQG